MTAPLWITGPPTPAIEGRCGGPVPHSSYTTSWDTTQDRRLVELVATIHNAADGKKPTLASIGRQLERQGIPTKTGARTWAPSSVKALLDRARGQGLLDSVDGDS